MPLTKKGEKIMRHLVEQYGEKKAKKIFYAGKNSGRFTGVDSEVNLTEMVALDQVHFKKTQDGYLVAQPRVARTGIQLYSPKEVGKHFDRMVKVYRPEQEVFSQDTIRSFAHRPVTLDHPPEMVNDANWKKYAKGHTIDPIVRDGEFVRVPIMLMDQDTIKAFESGRNQLSMGYTCDLKWEPGVTDDGEEYDAIQTNLRMNHLALVANARGGDKLRIGDEETQDQDLVHCPDCDAMISDDAEVCPNCGYEMTDGEERELVSDEDLYADSYQEDYNENHDPRTGQFASGPGGGTGSGRTRTKKPSTTSKEATLKGLGYAFTKPFVKGGGAKHGVAYPGGGHTGPIFHTKEEAVAHAEEHATRTGVLQAPSAPPPPPRGPGATAAPVQGPKQPRAGEHEPDFFGPEGGGPPAPHSGQRQVAATAAATGIPNPEALAKQGPGRPRARNPDGTFVNPRPGEAGYVARGARASGGGGGGGAEAGVGGSGFSPGKTTFKTHGEAATHIRLQRRRWKRARPVLHGATFVARRGFGFTGGRIPGLRRQVGSPFYTLHHDQASFPWTIVFDQELDFLQLSDKELTPVELVDFNPNHDPITGEFTGGSIATANVSGLAFQSRHEARTSTFSTPDVAKQHAAAQLQTWKRHLASQEDAIKEIKKQIAFWEKAKVRPHVEYETRGRLGGLLGEKRVPVRTHYTVHIDSADLESIDSIQVTDVDLMQAQEWDDQLLLEDLRVPETDEMALTHEQETTP